MANELGNQHFEMMFGLSPISTKVVDKDKRIVYVNDAYTKMWGLNLENAKKLKSSDIASTERCNLYSLYDRVLNGEVLTTSIIYCKVEGIVKKDLWVQSHLYPIVSDDINYIVVIQYDITKRKQEELKTQEKKEMFQALYENAPLPYQSLNENGTFRDVNPAWLKTLGYTREEVIGKYYKDFLHPDWQSHFEKNFPAFKAKGYVHNVQFKIRHKDGHFLDISFEGCIGYNPDGSFRETYCVFQDITQRNLAESKLHEAIRKTNTLINNLPGIVYRCNNTKRWTMEFMKGGCEDLTGYKCEDIIQDNVISFGELIYPDDIEKVWNTVQKGVNNHLRYEVEYRIITKSGEIKWVWERGVCVDYCDKSEKKLEGFITDVTDRVLARKRIEESKGQLNTLINTLPDYIWLKNIKGVYLSCNRLFEEFFGAKESDIVGNTDYDFVDKELADFFRMNDKVAMAKGSPSVNEEVVVRAVDGEKVLLETVKTPMYGVDGNLIGVLGIGHDITEKKRIENELLEKKRQIQAIFDDPSTFIGILDTKGLMIDCNKIALDFINRDISDVFEVPFVDTPWWINNYEGRKRLAEAISKAKNGLSDHFESILKGAKGENKYINVSIRPIRNQDGEVYKLLAEGQDVTEKRLMEKALNQSEEKYKRLTENAKDMIYRMSIPEGRYEYVNKSALEIFGVSHQVFYNNPLTIKDLIHPDWRDYLKERWNDIINGVLTPTYEYQIITPQGKTKWIYQRNVYVNDDSGKLIAIEGIVTDITEIKKIQEELQRNQDRYNKAQALGKVGNWEYNLQEESFWASAESKKIYGFSRDFENFTTEEVENCIPDRVNVHQALVDLIEHNKPYDLQFEIITNDNGVSKIIHSTAVLEKDQKGNPLRVTGLIQDVTEQYYSDQAKQALHRRLQLATKSAGLGVWDYDILNDKLSWDDRVKEIYDVDDTFTYDFEGWSKYIHEEDVAHVATDYYKAISGNSEFSSEWRIVKDSGEIRYVEGRGVVIRNDNNDPVSMAGVIIDITERYNAVQEQINLNQRLTLATESAEIGIWDYDIVNDNLNWDDKVYSFYGLSKDMKINFNSWSNILHPEDYDEVVARYSLALSGEKDFDVVWRIITPDNQVKYIEGHGIVSRNQEGIPIRMIGVNIDITSRVENEKEIQQYRHHLEEIVEDRTRELREANQEMESFSYSISHDLRAPLRSISGFASILQEEYYNTFDDEGKRLLNNIIESSISMNTLITEILNLSRISRKELIKREVDMEKIIRACYESVINEKDKKQFSLIINKLDKTFCDPSALKIVWTNLLGNAVKYSHKSPVKKIEISSIKEEGFVRYSIKDWGVGFNQEYSNKLFGVFQRLHSIKDFPGTGIGLAIVKRIVNKHLGEVSASSEEGKGAIFSFTLPIYETDSDTNNDKL